MTVIESAGSFTMPPLTGTLEGLWEVILDLTDNLPPMSWALIGGQMVMAHGLAAGRTPTRASQDVDILGNLTASSTALRTVVTAVRDLGFEPEPSIDGKRLHRFVRTTDNQVIDVLAPDHSPPGWKPTTVPPLQTIRIAGATRPCNAWLPSASPRAAVPATCPCPASWDPSSSRRPRTRSTAGTGNVTPQMQRSWCPS
jgi:hypothetical protein